MMAAVISSAAILLPFAAAILFLHFEKSVAIDSFILGSGSWGFGAGLKLIVYQLIVRKLRHDPDRILRVSAINGLVSGVTELGAALALFPFLQNPDIWDIVGFGVGIGTIEAFLVGTVPNPLKGTALEKAASELDAAVSRLHGVRRFVIAQALPWLERIIAAFIHIGTRGLVFVTYRTANPVPFLLALAAFFFADGIVGYRLLYQGKLTDFRVLGKVYAILALIAVAVVAGFLSTWPLVASSQSSPIATLFLEAAK